MSFCFGPILKYGLEQSIAYWISLPVFLLSLLFSRQLQPYFQLALTHIGYTRETGNDFLSASLYSGWLLTIGLGWSRSPHDLNPYIACILGIFIVTALTSQESD